jgi:AAA+ ATPase superfamily predicted ATPase
MTAFVNREDELTRLEEWWNRAGDGSIGLVWGRRRVGKTLLVQRFAEGKRAVFHTGAGRPVEDELAQLSRAASTVLTGGLRDVATRPFTDWEDALETFAAAARSEPLLLVLDEFPTLVDVSTDLENRLRAFWDRAQAQSKLRILLLGSALRTMERIQTERAPLYGRIDLSLLVHPFRPHEAALMLRRLKPADRALVYGLVGGVPLYLEWWDQRASVRDNLLRLVCTPGGQLLNEGELVLASELDLSDLGRRIVYAVATGRTKFSEIQQVVRTDPTRTLDRLGQLRIVEKVVPVTADPRRARTSFYRIADNLLAFWLAIVDRYRAEIERGLGRSVLPVLVSGLDDHLGKRYEEAFRFHLRRLADAGELGDGIVAIGPFWAEQPQPVEIDAVALAGRDRRAVLVGESKWARTEDASRLSRVLAAKAQALPNRAADLRYAVCAREQLTNVPQDALAYTAADIFRVNAA